MIKSQFARLNYEGQTLIQKLFPTETEVYDIFKTMGFVEQEV
jgi:hypothetical protein